MLYVKAFHIISLVAWFAGLFYLPRLFVYHVQSQDSISIERFKIMEWRLYYAITTPAAIATLIFGLWLMSYNWSYYLSAGWMHAKLSFILLLFLFHGLCGHYLKRFRADSNTHSERFFRFFNEVPTVLLVAIVLLVVVKPF